MCDKIVEETEKFGIILALTSNNLQVRTGRDRSIGIIRDSTGRIVVSIEDGIKLYIAIQL